METKIKLYGVKWDVTTAGPSPDENKRTEVFFFGCDRATNGNPCKGCFNNALWDNSIATIEHTPESIVENIKLHASNKYVTIGGGEPTDQHQGLLKLVTLLKEEGFHVMLYTWRNLNDVIYKTTDFGLVRNMVLLTGLVDIIVDGEFIPEERLYDDSKEDGFLSSIGSGNQIVWDMSTYEGYHMRDLDAIALDDNDRLIYLLKDKSTEALRIYPNKEEN